MKSRSAKRVAVPVRGATGRVQVAHGKGAAQAVVARRPADGATAPTLRRGGLLLEVVVAMTILCTAMGLLGAQLTRGIALSSFAEEQMIAQQFADRILALIEYDLETQELLFSGEQEVFESFGEDEPEKFWRVRDQYPGYFWRVTVKPPAPTSAPDLPVKQVLVEILHQEDRQKLDTLDGAQVVRQIAFLRTEPAKLDLAQLGLGAGALGGGAGGPQLPGGLGEQLPDILALVGGMGDGLSFQQLVSQMDRDTVAMLMTFVQQFIASNGGIPPGLGSLDLGNLADLVGQRDSGGVGGAEDEGGGAPGNGQGADNIRQQIEEALRRNAGGRGGPGGSGGPGGPGMGRGGNENPEGAPPPPPQGQRPGRGGRGGGRGPDGPGGGQRGGGQASDTPRLPPGGGSGPNGEYTIEDLMRLRDEYQRQQEEGGI